MIGQVKTNEHGSEDMNCPQHIPVMLNEAIEHLALKPKSIIVDGTLGMGGHAAEILKSIGPEGLLIGIDRDELSLQKAEEHLKNYGGQCNFVHDDFKNLSSILSDNSVKRVDGILLDLGISSFQLDNNERGFGIRSDGPLDMRMDTDSHISAYDLINSLSENEIATILKDYGEEKFYNRIARKMVAERAKHPITTTGELRQVVLKSLPFKKKHYRIHPATRTFQAIRIAVNRELESLEFATDDCISKLNVGGRLVVISFHSLEDRIVKQHFKNFAKLGQIRLIVTKPLRPTEQEILHNSRARSAKMRVAERLV